jgi:DNA-binding NtrC family response regulator
VQKGKFREDLYFRLSVVPIHMPSLRERKEDLPSLAQAFLRRMAEPSGQPPRTLDDSALASLLAHDWPGNIRELRNVLERGVYLSPPSGGSSAPVKLVAMPAASEPVATLPEFDAERSYRDNKERWEHEFEKRYLTWLMQRAQGNISRAAREADMDRKYLHKLLKKHAIVT